jgi:hypothetical protein
VSKQSEAKEVQGYRNQPDCCQNCKHFTKDTIEKSYYGSTKTWTEDKNMRCGVGGFAAKKTAVCNNFELKPAA